MDCVTRRQTSVVLHNFPCPNCVRFLDSENLIHNLEQNLKRRSNGVAPVYCRVSMKDLLKNFSICYKSLALGAESRQ